jgi:hypothetical protein
MSDHAIAIVRWVMLASAAINLLQATVLFDVFQRRLVQPWLAVSERTGARVPAIMRDARIHRVWPWLMTAFFLGLWWYFGTSAGVDMLRHA